MSLSANPYHRPVDKKQIGPREYLLCPKCEGRLNKHETYVSRLLRELRDSTPQTGRILTKAEYNYAHLKLFSLSVIWRCHASSKFFFSDVDLGPHAEVMRQMVLKDNPGPPAKYGLFLLRYRGSETAERVVFPPRPTRMGSCRAYVMYALGFNWMFMVDSQAEAPSYEHRDVFVGARDELVLPIEQVNQKEFLQYVKDRIPERALKSIRQQ